MMTQEKKIRSLFLIAAFLFISNIILLLFLVFNKNNTDVQNNLDTRSVIETFLQDQIGFDTQQMTLYKNIRKDDFEKRVPIFDSLKSAKNKFYENIYADSINDNVINKSAASVSEKQMVVDKHMLQYFRNIRRICTTEQREKFDSSFKEVVEKITAIKLRSKNADNH